MLLHLLKLCRPKQWIKNGFVFGPLVFSGLFLDLGAILASIWAFLFFSLAASAVYIVNDIKDIHLDRAHPKKSLSRPLASGAVSIPAAYLMLFLLYALLIGCYFWRSDLFIVLFIYIIINIGYTFALKRVPVVDIFTVASGFVLRVYAGIVVLEVDASMWMLITTLCLALYLAAIKRRQELVTMASDASRSVLGQYSVSLIDRYAEMSATGALMFYSLFVLNARPELAITIPFVLLGLFRYWYVVDILEGGESPTDVFWADWVLIGCVVAWVSLCLLILGGWFAGI